MSKTRIKNNQNLKQIKSSSSVKHKLGFRNLNVHNLAQINMEAILHYFDTSSWSSCISMIIFCYLVSFMSFGLIYMGIEAIYHFICLSHASLHSHAGLDSPQHDHDSQNMYNVTKFGDHCITHLTDENTWIGFFQFSFETQTTIGYGVRTIKLYCYPSIVISWFQTILVSVLMQPIIGGLIFRKLLRPIEEKEEQQNKQYLDNLYGKLSNVGKSFKNTQSNVEKLTAVQSNIEMMGEKLKKIETLSLLGNPHGSTLNLGKYQGPDQFSVILIDPACNHDHHDQRSS